MAASGIAFAYQEGEPMKVKDILQHKGTEVHTISPYATIQHAMETF